MTTDSIYRAGTVNTAPPTTCTQQEVTLLLAKLAQAGQTVIKGANGDFTVTRWGLSRYCPDYPALVAFAFKLGVHHD